MKSGKEELLAQFDEAPLDAMLSRPVTAAAIGRPVSWLKDTAYKAGGIPFQKNRFFYFYRKSDILRWIEANAERVLPRITPEVIKRSLYIE
jgi:hypothetical protein